jgi:hypothetical protein
VERSLGFVKLLEDETQEKQSLTGAVIEVTLEPPDCGIKEF